MQRGTPNAIGRMPGERGGHWLQVRCHAHALAWPATEVIGAKGMRARCSECRHVGATWRGLQVCEGEQRFIGAGWRGG